MWSPRPYDPSYVQAVVRMGEEGKSPAQMAAELDVSLADFEAWRQRCAEFAVALADAETRARAWWDAIPLKAFQAGESFRAAAWARTVAQRFGRPSHRPPNDAQTGAQTGAKPGAEPVIEAVFDIPDNGRERRRAPGARRAADRGAGA